MPDTTPSKATNSPTTTCQGCGGAGEVGMHPCRYCDGSGRVPALRSPSQGQQEPVAALRPAVLWFAQQMEAALRRNDHKGGWGGMLPSQLLERLEEELTELDEAVTAFSRTTALRIASDESIIAEAADVANFAMMLADNHGPKLGNTQATPVPPAPHLRSLVEAVDPNAHHASVANGGVILYTGKYAEDAHARGPYRMYTHSKIAGLFNVRGPGVSQFSDGNVKSVAGYCHDLNVAWDAAKKPAAPSKDDV